MKFGEMLTTIRSRKLHIEEFARLTFISFHHVIMPDLGRNNLTSIAVQTLADVETAADGE